MASDCRLLLEDGSALLLEDGDNLLLETCGASGGGCDLLTEDGFRLLTEDGFALLVENCVPSGGGGGTGCDLLTEDGFLLLQEDGFALLLENCGTVPPSVEVVAGGGFVRPRPRRVVVDLLGTDDDVAVATSVLALMRLRRWRLDG